MKRKKKKRKPVAFFLICALLTAGLLIQSKPVLAVDHASARQLMTDAKETGEMDISRVDTWYQGRVPDMQGRFLRSGNSSSTVAGGGCSYYAAAYMLLKMGQLNIRKGESPETVLDRMEAIDGWLSFGKMDYERIGEAYPDVSCIAYKEDISELSYEEQLAYISDQMARGRFVILTISGPIVPDGHYIFVDSVEGDDMVIGDSAYEGTRWSDTHAREGTSIIDCSLFTCEGVAPADCASIYD